MCGIVGFSGFAGKKFNADKIKLLMLWNSMERGEDATGYWTTIKHFKDNVPASEALSKTNEIIPDSIFIGHVRASTVGKNELINAHPYVYGNLVWCHNGTLKNHKRLLRNYKLHIENPNDCTDSYIIGRIIESSKNLNVLNEIDGPATMLLANKNKPEFLHVFRNEERSLFRGVIDNEGMYLSSIKESLKMIGCTNIKEIPDNNIYSIKAGEFKATSEIKAEKVKNIFDNIVNKWVPLIGYPNPTDFYGIRNTKLSESIATGHVFVLGEYYENTSDETWVEVKDKKNNCFKLALSALDISNCNFVKGEPIYTTDSLALEKQMLKINTVVYYQEETDNGIKIKLSPNAADVFTFHHRCLSKFKIYSEDEAVDLFRNELETYTNDLKYFIGSYVDDKTADELIKGFVKNLETDIISEEVIA